MKTASSIIELIGSTPMLELVNYSKSIEACAKIYAKIESFNPCSSIKDRVALSMIEDAIKKGELNSESTIIEPTSGNTGIGLAMVAAAKGLKLILTMPENMSVERCALLKFLGAELVLTDKSKGMNGAIEKAIQIAQTIENSIILDQFKNPANPATHYCCTAKEII
ncbi:MAG: cysteine synthase family protein, partial [Rikenellaceae bacterium]